MKPQKRRRFPLSPLPPGGHPYENAACDQKQDLAPVQRNRSIASHESMRIQLLGAFRVAVGSRVIGDVEWRRRKASALVKILALEPRHRLHREQITDLLWRDLPFEQAANNFHQTLYIARRILEASASKTTRWLRLEDDFLTLSPQDPLEIDVEAFVEAAGAARQGSDLGAYQRALNLYGGELLPEDRYEEWASSQRESLRQVHISLLAAIAEIYQAGGNNEQAIGTFKRVLENEPAHEGACRRLMELYASSGEREQALKQYQLLREALRELDAEPEPTSQQLYRQILAGQHAGLEAKPPLVLGNLPEPLTSFIGRAREKGEVRQLIGSARLLTLTGTAGSDKTRLAIEVARDLHPRYPDGVWLVELAPVSDPEFIPHIIASALSIQEAAGQELTQTLIAHLKLRRLLLVLDNCEHLLFACAQLAEVLLRACPNLRILATSREPLHIMGEVAWLVPSLSVPDLQHLPSSEELSQYEAVRLFVERAQMVQIGFEVTAENGGSVAELCYRLDGIPLAIELAAARMRMLGVDQILSRLDDRFRLLTGGSRTALNRQQTLRAAVDWSYDLLSPRERITFRQLAVFGGGFSLEAAEQVVADDEPSSALSGPSNKKEVEPRRDEILDVLSGLVDKSLVIAERHGGQMRYRLLETMREYAREHLARAGEVEKLARRHVNWCMALAEQAHSQLWGSHHMTWVDRLEIEQDNLRAALGWCLANDTSSGLRLATLLSHFWILRGYITEGIDWLSNLLARPCEQSSLQATALLSAFMMSARSGDYRLQAETFIERILDIYDDSEDLVGRIQAYQIVGVLTLAFASYQKAKAFFESSLSLAAGVGFAPGEACAVHFLGVHAEAVGDYLRAETLLKESIERYRKLDIQSAVTPIFANIVQMPFPYGVQRRWRIVDEETLILIRQIRADAVIGFALANLGNLARARGENARAQELLESSLEEFRRVGDQGGMSQVLSQLGNLFAGAGEFEPAQRALQESLAIRRTLGDRRGVGRTLNNLANAATLQREYGRASSLLGESLRMFEEMKDKPGLAQTYNHFGNLALEQGDFVMAASMYEKSTELFQQLGKRGGPILLNLAACARLRGENRLAHSFAESALALFQENGDRSGVAQASQSLRN